MKVRWMLGGVAIAFAGIAGAVAVSRKDPEFVDSAPSPLGTPSVAPPSPAPVTSQRVRPAPPREVPEKMHRAFDEATVFELLALNPWVPPLDQDAEHAVVVDAGTRLPRDEFHGFVILGRKTITDPATRARLIDALEAGIRDSDGTRAGCFAPRHALRVSGRGGTSDFVICFECLQIAMSFSDGNHSMILVSRSPRDVFNQALRDAGLPIAPETPPSPEEKVTILVAARAGIGPASGADGVAHPEATIAKIRWKFRACLTKALASDPKAGGTFELTFDIDASGATTSTSVSPTAAGPASLADCIASAGRNLKFEPPAGGATSITAKIVLKAR